MGLLDGHGWRRRLASGRGEDNLPEMLVGHNNNEAGPNGMANDTM